MVGKVLTGNGITRYDQGAYALVGGVAEGFCAAVELSDAEREELLQLCRQRLDAFREQRGEEVGCLLTPAASGTGAATARRSAARSNTGCSPGPKAAANAAAHTRINGPWRWTTSCPRTRAARTTTATCRPSASAAMPPSAMQFAYARGRPDFLGVQASYGHREVGCVFCALEGSGRVLLENALEALHRRRLSRERGGSALQITHHRVGAPVRCRCRRSPDPPSRWRIPTATPAPGQASHPCHGFSPRPPPWPTPARCSPQPGRSTAG